MKNILSSRNRTALESFLEQDPLLIFDFDGTLSPIVKNPDRARMRPSTRILFRTLTRAFPCAVLSGRKRSDVKQRLQGLRLVSIIGNHGIETGSTIRQSRGIREKVRSWAEHCHLSLPNQGVRIEDKGYTLSIHCRVRAMRLHIEAVLQQLKGARIIPGKDVYNVLPRLLPDKGSAVRLLMKKRGASRALYIGDDDTDEDVFALRGPEQLLTIRVGRRTRSRAQYYLARQSDMDALLTLLLAYTRKSNR